jgi:nucleoside-diphosphate-sugar epimerase
MTTSKATQIPSCRLDEADLLLGDPTPAVIESCREYDGDFMVLGAAGKMGLHVCVMLRRAFDACGKKTPVVAVSRFGSVNERDTFERLGIRTIACDLANETQLAKLRKFDNVIFMAGAKFGTASRPELLRLMNFEMPGRVAQHFSDSRISALSTGCVYSYVPVTSPGSNEKSETDPIGAYAQSCLGREQSFTRAARELGTRVALIRLNYSVEFRYGVLVDIASKVLARKPIDVSTGHFNVIWQRDAVAHIIQAHAFASDQPFILNVTGPRAYDVRTIATQFAKYFGEEPIFTGSEAPTAWLNDASLSHRLLGPPGTSIEQMIEWTAAWLSAGYPTFDKPTGFEKRDGSF